jgi:oxepin-CoA hydrolase/3-oxo-5,6-dehydrosuberyl-CoA semialdehyde dehydrogenase
LIKAEAMIRIHDKKGLKAALDELKPGAKPLWGKMSPQHVVEHLAAIMKISTGKNEVGFYNSQEIADRIKEGIIYSDQELKPGIKNPLLGEDPPPLVHRDFASALDELYSEVEYFETYYQEHPEAMHVQPRMGKLNYHEWLILHNKHFTHHFKQYDLLKTNDNAH